MALNDKKSAFGFDVEEKFKKVTSKPPVEPVVVEEDQQEPAQGTEQKPARKSARASSELVVPKQPERKRRKVQLLTYDSLVDRMDAYAAKMGVSRAVVFEAAVSAYLDQVDPVKKK